MSTVLDYKIIMKDATVQLNLFNQVLVFLKLIQVFGVWVRHSLIFPQTHYRIFELSVDTGVFAEPKETEVSQKDLQIFINYCMRVAENKKLCFGFHVDKIESVTIHMW